MLPQDPLGIDLAHLSIGDSVLVNRVWRSTKEPVKSPQNRYNWRCKHRGFQSIDLKEPRWGQITGIKTAFEGFSEYISDEDGWSFKPTKTHSFWLLRFGMRNREEMITANDVLEWKIATLQFEVPITYSNQPEWPIAWRDQLREEMKNAKRDEKGRFIKWHR